MEHTKTDVMSDSSKDNTLPQTLHAQKPNKRTCFRSGLFNHLDDHFLLTIFERNKKEVNLMVRENDGIIIG